MLRRKILGWGVALALFSALAPALPARAAWTAANVQIQTDTKWNTTAGSGKSESLTSGSARMDGNSYSYQAGDTGTTSDLDRTYKRTYTKTDTPPNLTVTITIETYASADTVSVNSVGSAHGSGSGSATPGIMMSPLSSSASQAALGAINPPLVQDPKGPSSGTTVLTATGNVTCQLTESSSAQSSNHTGSEGKGDGWAKVTFSDP